MAHIDPKKRIIQGKIVYYGPGLCGKTTNLEYVSRHVDGAAEMMSLATEGDRTIFFDYMPMKLGQVAGIDTSFKLYTVPGQVRYNQTRKMVLKNVDGVVFVADSQDQMMDANLESLDNLFANLDELSIDPEQVPLVLQYNKRDLPNILPPEQLNRALNEAGHPTFLASALRGDGVVETLSKICNMVFRQFTLEFGNAGRPTTDRPSRPPAAPPPAPQAAPPSQQTGPLQAATTADTLPPAGASTGGLRPGPRATADSLPAVPTPWDEGTDTQPDAVAMIAAEIRQQKIFIDGFVQRQAEATASVSSQLRRTAEQTTRALRAVESLERAVSKLKGSVQTQLEKLAEAVKSKTDRGLGAVAPPPPGPDGKVPEAPADAWSYITASLQQIEHHLAKTGTAENAGEDKGQSNLSQEIYKLATLRLAELHKDIAAVREHVKQAKETSGSAVSKAVLSVLQKDLPSRVQFAALQREVAALGKKIGAGSSDGPGADLAALERRLSAKIADGFAALQRRLAQPGATATDSETGVRAPATAATTPSATAPSATTPSATAPPPPPKPPTGSPVSRFAAPPPPAATPGADGRPPEPAARPIAGNPAQAASAAEARPVDRAQDTAEARPDRQRVAHAADEAGAEAKADTADKAEARADAADEARADTPDEAEAKADAAEQAEARADTPDEAEAKANAADEAEAEDAADEQAKDAADKQAKDAADEAAADAKADTADEAKAKDAADEQAKDAADAAGAAGGTPDDGEKTDGVEEEDAFADDPQHRNAARIARVMVADLHLYYKQEVEEGLKQDDFFERNKEALADMRTTYESRVSAEVRAQRDYLQPAVEAFIIKKRKELGLE